MIPRPLEDKATEFVVNLLSGSISTSKFIGQKDPTFDVNLSHLSLSH